MAFSRFRCIAQDKSLWAGTVLTEVGSRPRTDRMINSFLVDDIEELVLEKQGAIFSFGKCRILGLELKNLKKTRQY